jgi:putative transposase
MVERDAFNRVGQKGRTCHRWYERGVRPPGLADKRFESLYLFAACRPGADQAFALALPEATTKTMSLFLTAFAEQLAPGTHAVLLLDRAGWHGAGRLAVPENVTLLPLPAYSPDLVWGFACQALRIAAPPFRPLGSV